MVKVRARSKEAKHQKFEEIIKVGRDLFIHQSEDGFSTSQLAEKVGMKQASLYKYIQSKRDLWFAIVIHDLEHMVQNLQETIEKHSGTHIDLIVKMAEFYFDLAISEHAIIRLLYRTDAPNSNKIGPYEQKYNPASYYIVLLKVITNAIEEKEISVDDPTFFMFYLFSILHGATLLIGERGFHQDPKKFKNYIISQFKDAVYRYKT